MSFAAAPRILILGASGLLGSQLARASAGRDVILTAHMRPVPGARYLDLRDLDSIRPLLREVAPTVILLAAAEAFVERCEREPELTRRINVEAPRSIAEDAGRSGAQLVVFSSEYVFDGAKGLYSESDDVRPINEYGHQKVDLERIAARLPRHLICRTSGLFGWDPARTNFVCQVIDRLRAGKPFTVPSDQLITPTYAPAAAAAVLDLIDAQANGVFHVAGPHVMSRVAFAEQIAQTFALPMELIVPRPTRDLGLLAVRPERAGLATEKLSQAIGGTLTPARAALEEMRAHEPSV